jgi:hypothetical protein
MNATWPETDYQGSFWGHPTICLVGMRKRTINFRKYIQGPGWDFNQEHAEKKSTASLY